MKNFDCITTQNFTIQFSLLLLFFVTPSGITNYNFRDNYQLSKFRADSKITTSKGQNVFGWILNFRLGR